MGENEFFYEAKEGITKNDLMNELVLKDERLLDWRKNVLIAINCEHTGSANPVISENDEVAFFPPLSGG